MKVYTTSCTNVASSTLAKSHDVCSTNNDSKKNQKSYPLLLNAEQVAELLNVSKAHIYRMRNSARLPEPVKFGGSVRWPLDELQAWISAGLPNRIRWNQMKGGAA